MEEEGREHGDGEGTARKRKEVGGGGVDLEIVDFFLQVHR